MSLLRVLVTLTVVVAMSCGCAARVRPATLVTNDQLEVTLKGSCPAPDPPGTPAPCHELGAFDRFFTDAYQAAQNFTRDHHTPVVLVSGSSLILVLEGAGPETVRVIPDLYHVLKAVAHFPFAVYLTMDRATGRPLSAATRTQLEAFVAKEPAARAELPRYKLSSTQIVRQHLLLDTAIGFVRQALAEGTVSREQLQAFARSVGPLLLENTRDAGCAQVLSTHRQMVAWKSAHSSLDWSSLVVVNRGAHQARFRNAATQYFAWLLGGTAPSWNYPGESLHVVYAEDIFPPAANTTGTDLSMEVFSTITLDAVASRAFFGDEWRLSEDVLSDGAAQCVAQLPAAERWRK
jgi:hypothetical protein